MWWLQHPRPADYLALTGIFDETPSVSQPDGSVMRKELMGKSKLLYVYSEFAVG
jgi:hypothetical protein